MLWPNPSQQYWRAKWQILVISCNANQRPDDCVCQKSPVCTSAQFTTWWFKPEQNMDQVLCHILKIYTSMEIVNFCLAWTRRLRQILRLWHRREGSSPFRIKFWMYWKELLLCLKWERPFKLGNLLQASSLWYYMCGRHTRHLCPLHGDPIWTFCYVLFLQQTTSFASWWCPHIFLSFVHFVIIRAYQLRGKPFFQLGSL